VAEADLVVAAAGDVLPARLAEVVAATRHPLVQAIGDPSLAFGLYRPGDSEGGW
jgi:hypothetical protein